MKNSSKFLEKFHVKSVIANFLVSFAIFLAFLLTLEIVLRTTHLFGARISWSEPDPLLGFRFVPNSQYWFSKENDHPITGRINSYGWRDKEWLVAKPQNTYRIAVLGDSMVEAFQVESDLTFLALTERQLNENHKLNVELMNFGRSGYTQSEELLVLQNHVGQFSPNMVIVFFMPGNDIADVSRETAPELLRPFYTISEKEELIPDTNFVKTREFKSKCCINSFKRHSALISFLTERYNYYKWERQKAAAKKRAKTKMSKEGMSSSLALCTAHPDTVYVKNYQLNKNLIKAMAEYCKEKGIQFMLVTIDTDAYIPEIEKSYKAIDSTFDANFFEDDLKDHARSLSVEYLGLQRVFRQAFENTGIVLHWGHWNYEGHKVVANALTAKLKEIIVPSAEW